MPKTPTMARSSRIGKRTGKKLTVRMIGATEHTGASYGDAGGGAKQEILWDTEVSGLGLRIYPSGRRSWCLRYRVNGRRRIVTLGPYGVYTLPMARDEARARLLELRQTRKDPMARPDEIPTVRDLIPRYLEDRRSRVKASTLATYEAKFNMIEKALGGLGIDSVEPRDALSAFSRWTRENGPNAANQAARLLRSLIDFAQRHGLRDGSLPNPVAVVERHPEQRKGRELTDRELERVGRELRAEEERRPDSADTVAALRLLLLTGARRREITGLLWSEVDFNRSCLRLADSKTGAKTIPLSQPAVDILAALRRSKKDVRVFPKRTHEVGFAIQYTWRRVRERADCEDVRIHDLRHTFVTRGLAANYSEAQVGKLVGHKSAATTRRYEHLQADPLRAAAEAIGVGLAADLDGLKDTLHSPDEE